MAAAGAGIVLPPIVLAAQSVAPHPVADERLSLTPERTPEAVGHGGPLAIPSVGVVASGAGDTSTPQQAASYVSDETPSHAQPTSVHPRTPVRPAQATTAASRATVTPSDSPATASAVNTQAPTTAVSTSETTATTTLAPPVTTTPETTQPAVPTTTSDTTTADTTVPEVVVTTPETTTDRAIDTHDRTWG